MWPVNLGFRLLGFGVESEDGKFHYSTTLEVIPLVEGGGLTLLAVQSCAIHRLAHGPQDQTNSIFDDNIVLVLLLQQALCRAIVCSDTCCFPARVVA